jgi:ubiquinone/menaquinone biosynthesis C-methylase UbiE
MLRNDWWETEYAHGDISIHMTGGAQGKDHPSRKWLIEHIPEGAKVLDVGCCNALMLQTFMDANKKIDYTGVDRLPEFVEWCKEHYPEAHFQRSDAEDLRDFEDNSFDYVTSRHVIEHLPHYSQHIIEMYRVANKEVIIIPFLIFTGHDGDIIQYGMHKEGGSWYNRYSKNGIEVFLAHNNITDFDIIEDYQESGNAIITIRKEQK